MMLIARPLRPIRAILALAGTLVLLAGVAACGGAAAADASTVTAITVTIVDRVVTPPPARIDLAKGQTVRITVTSDVADMVHVHGYDKSVTLVPATAGVIEFVADQDGLFEVETHGQQLQLCQLAVR